jgi:ubiquinone/menaquinone biosynthesis C-methylase UbiE
MNTPNNDAEVESANLRDLTGSVPKGKFPKHPIGDNDPSENPFAVGLRDSIDSGWYNIEKCEIFEGVPIYSTDVVVDVGCGDGGAIRFCANQGAEVIFLDLNATKVKSIREELLDTSAKSIRGIVGSAEEIDLAEGTADKIICTEVIEHVDNPEKVMSELFRIGKPGALYVLTVPEQSGEDLMKDTAPKGYFEKPNHIRIFDQESFKALVEASGLEVIKQHTLGAYWSVFFSIFWNSGQPLSPPWDPALVSWTKTWHNILEHKNGTIIKNALNKALPKNQVIVARKAQANVISN